MSTQTENPFDWIRQIPGNLFQLDEKPLLGNSPTFPWEEFSSLIDQCLQIKPLSISSKEWQWRSKAELLNGIGDDARGVALTIVPLPGLVWWVMPERTITRLMELLLAEQKTQTPQAIDKDFISVFYRFLAMEILSCFEKANVDKKLSPVLTKEEGLPLDHCLCLDIEFNAKGEFFYGRIFLSSEFRKAWMQRYTQQSVSNLNSPLVNSLSVIAHIEAGRINLTPTEWKKIHPGDFVILDHCSLDPDEEKGRVMIAINGIPFFRAKIKQGSLKILEHPLYHEVDTNMVQSPKDEKSHESEEDNNDDFDLDLDSEEESDSDTDTDSDTDADSNTDTDSDFDEELSDSDLDEELSDSDLNDEEDTKPSHKSDFSVEQPDVTDNRHQDPIEPSKREAVKEKLSIEEIPLQIVIEVGRIQMSIKKLLELQPGNMLDLDLHPEAGVDMVVNGKKIARGELLRIGDVFGIRIVELS